MRRMFVVLILCGLLMGLPGRAQSPTLLSLETGSTSLQTGQFYEVSIRVHDVSELWLADMQISYDPAMLYIYGTKSGSPVQQGAFFNPAASAVIRNQVEGGLLSYTLSLLAPADPVSGDGIIGTFRIYPLVPGTTQVLFSQAELAKAIFETRDDQRVGVGSEAIAFTPVLLELTITGEQVEPPSEATATPLPTETSPPPPQNLVPTQESTLVNVTAAPRTPEPLATLLVPATSSDSGSSLPLLAAIAVMLVGGIGAVIVLWRIRRPRK